MPRHIADHNANPKMVAARDRNGSTGVVSNRPMLMPSQRSEELGRRLAIMVENRHWDICRAIIDECQREERADAAPLGDGLDTALSELVCTRTANYLESIGVYTVEAMLKETDATLLAIPGFGAGALAELKAAAAKVLAR